eukprot:CAMPEP_0174230206 /NCGR_PEP_ID=MMETSP0417-20130205/1012_1 /TAXON_ID=242541 /ORGANISM="Mayorella sp, Strain BSH-02190019" /LENGTH=283 /DNA_ID=CAMNT_0015307851 /DNA_START=38 /DNA_END=886 /DNA_ORIENTATION=-
MEVIIESAVPYLHEGLRRFADVEIEVGSNADTLCHLVTGYFLYLFGGMFFYLFFASISYYYYFVLYRSYYFPGKNHLPSDEALRNQIRTEIGIALPSIPGMALLTVPFNVLAHLGYTYTYRRLDEYGYPYVVFSILMFLFFSDMTIYWIHRGLHSKALYKNVHKAHHTFRVVTPFSSHAFSALDGWSQSTPYLVFPFILPIHNWTLFALYIGVNLWTVAIHDRIPYYKGSIVNSTMHHDAHHRFFFYNYGQYFSMWDKIGGSYRDPADLIADPSIKGSIKAAA